MTNSSIIEEKMNCFSCNALIPDIQWDVHDYMDSSPGCWKLFGQILEKEYSDTQYWKNHRITVDAFAVQHYGKPSPQAIQSVNLHLASLYLIYDKGCDVKLVDKGLTILAKYKSELSWLDPPKNVGQITVTNILEAKNAEEHCQLINDWGKSVWESWSIHHEAIKAFVERHQSEIF